MMTTKPELCYFYQQTEYSNCFKFKHVFKCLDIEDLLRHVMGKGTGITEMETNLQQRDAEATLTLFLHQKENDFQALITFM